MKKMRLLSLMMAALMAILCACAPTVETPQSEAPTATSSEIVDQTPEASMETQNPAVSDVPAESTDDGVTGSPADLMPEGVQLLDGVLRDAESEQITLYEDGTYSYTGMVEGMVSIVIDRMEPGNPLEFLVLAEQPEVVELEVKEDADLAGQLSYSVESCEYQIGANEDTRVVKDVLIHADEWDFRCRVLIPADALEEYQPVRDELYSSLYLEEGEEEIDIGMLLALDLISHAARNTDTTMVADGSEEIPEAFVWQVLYQTAMYRLYGAEELTVEDDVLVFTEDEMQALYDRCFAAGSLPEDCNDPMNLVSFEDGEYRLQIGDYGDYVVNYTPETIEVLDNGLCVSGIVLETVGGNAPEITGSGSITLAFNEGDATLPYSFLGLDLGD